MDYDLQPEEICLLQSINCNLDSLYETDVAKEIRSIFLFAITEKKITKDQYDRLLELLPLFRQQKPENKDSVAKDEDAWAEVKDDPHAQQKKVIRKLEHEMTQRLFIQYSVYQNNPRERKAGTVKKSQNKGLAQSQGGF